MPVTHLQALQPNPDTSRVRVVVALELLLHRDAIGQAIAMLRPEWEVIQLAPDELSDALFDRRPDVVICTDVRAGVDAAVPVWLVLDPAASRHDVIFIHGERAESGGLDLASLLGVIDQVCD